MYILQLVASCILTNELVRPLILLLASEDTRVCRKIKLFKTVNEWLSYVFSEKADWDIMDEQDTKHRCIVWTWTTNYVHHASGSDMSNE